MRELVAPWADQTLSRPLQVAEHAWDGVGVAVLPTSHGKDSAFDVVVIFAHRAVLPVCIAALMLQPEVRPDGTYLLVPTRAFWNPEVVVPRRFGRMELLGRLGDEFQPECVGKDTEVF